MEDCRHLRVYQCAQLFARNAHRLTSGFPSHLRRTLGAQLNNAAESIGSNIVEGCGRKNRHHGNTELIRYLHISHGSACEAQHRLAGARDRDFVDEKRYWMLENQLRCIKKMLDAWVRALESRDRGRIPTSRSGKSARTSARQKRF
jgi:four helix bundle protein